MTGRILIAAACILMGSAFARGQSGAFLSVHSAPAGLAVYVDSALVGRTPVDSLALAPGTFVLRVLAARERSWEGPALIETLQMKPGESVLRDVRPLRIGSVTSEPYGAHVSVGDSLLGSTPLLLPAGLEGSMVTLSLDGYESQSLPLTGDLHVLLTPKPGSAHSALAVNHSGNMTPVVLSAGVTVLAGASAAYCKIKADARYADFRSNGQPSDLDAVHRLDLLSGISLAVSELSLFVLTYQLLSR